MGSLTDRQIELVHAGWALLKPRAVRFVDVLYELPFSVEPQLRILFEGRMNEPHIKLAEALTFLIDHINDPTALQRELHRLGERHRDYSVKPHHFEAMERNVDRALELCLTRPTPVKSARPG